MDRKTMAEFVDAWGAALAGDVADKLTCRELEALTDLFGAMGEHELAATWTREHAWGDLDPEDQHYEQGTADRAALVAERAAQKGA